MRGAKNLAAPSVIQFPTKEKRKFKIKPPAAKVLFAAADFLC
jgi:hypothetical protein